MDGLATAPRVWNPSHGRWNWLAPEWESLPSRWWTEVLDEAGDGSHPRVLKGILRAKPNLLEVEGNVEHAQHSYTWLYLR